MLDINVEEVLKSMQSLDGANGYVIFNNEGIPLKRHEKSISADKAIHMAALISDLWNVSKRYIQRELRSPDVQNNQFIQKRMIQRPQEFVLNTLMNTQQPNVQKTSNKNQLDGDFTMVTLQLCGKAIEEARQAALLQAQAEAEAEKAKKGGGKEQEA